MRTSSAPESARSGSDRVWVALLVGLAMVRGLLYAALIPPWQAPDEPGHFEQAWLIARLGRIPTAQDADPELERALVASLYEWRYGDYLGRPLPPRMPDRLADLPPEIFAGHSRTLGRFSPAYLWLALWILPVQGEDLLVGLYLARCASVALNAMILVAAWRLFRLLIPEQPTLARAMALFLALHPQHTFINAAVGEGPLAELGATLALYGWAHLLIRGWTARGLAWALGGTVLGVVAKGTALYLIPLAPVALTLALVRGFRRYWERALLGAVLGLAALGLVGWWLPHMPGAPLLNHLFDTWRSGELKVEGNSSKSFDQILVAGIESYWFNLGWMNVPAPKGWYLVFWIAMLWSVEGWLLPRSPGPRTSSAALALIVVAAGLAVGGWIAFLVTPRGTWYYQGRYLFPAAAALTFLLIGGWARALPKTAQARFPAFLVAAMVAMEAIAFFPVVLSKFY